jgi:hypothetical protein
MLHVCHQVGSLNLGDTYAPQFAMFYRMFCQRLITLVNPDMDLRSAYDSGTEDQQVFVQNLSLFFTQFFKVGGHGRAGGGTPAGLGAAF